jgi:predicted metal-dependent phosphoesterase TrpH
MADGLAQVGLKGAFDGALRYVGNPALISRTHFARWLVETGTCTDTHEVFRRYLTEGKPGFVPHQWARLGDAVRWITEAGGLAVIAHPARYKFSANEEYALFSEFKAHGGRGVEVVTGSHTRPTPPSYAAMAKSLGCWPRAAATSTAPTKAAPTWAPCPTCRAAAGVAGAGAARQRLGNHRQPASLISCSLRWPAQA